MLCGAIAGSTTLQPLLRRPFAPLELNGNPDLSLAINIASRSLGRLSPVYLSDLEGFRTLTNVHNGTSGRAHRPVTGKVGVSMHEAIQS